MSGLDGDEPAGQLDSETGRSVMDLLLALVHARGVTALVATHDPAMLDLADRVLVLRDGALPGSAPVGAAVGAAVPVSGR